MLVRVSGLGFGDISPIIESQIAKNMGTRYGSWDYELGLKSCNLGSPIDYPSRRFLGQETRIF